MNSQQVQDAFSAMSDPAVRSKYRADPRAAYRDLCAEIGSAHGEAFPALPEEVEVKAVFNTADKCYVALPHLSGHLLGDDELASLQAAGGAVPTNLYAVVCGAGFYHFGARLPNREG